MTEKDIELVLKPKVDGTKNLDLLSNYKELFSKDEKIHSIQNNTDEVKKFILENKN